VTPTDLRLEPTVRAFCRAVGAQDLEVWLHLPQGTRGPIALRALEQRRIALEAGMHDEATAYEAELLIDAYDALVVWLSLPASLHHASATQVPDYYAVLGVDSSATFDEVDAAWRGLRTRAHPDPLVDQAWRVIGDPVNRASYDRARGSPAPSPGPDPYYLDPETPISEPPPRHLARLSIEGPEVRQVQVDRGGAVVVPLLLHVSGPGRYRGELVALHPSIRLNEPVDLPPGHHAIPITVHPAKMESDRVKAHILLQRGNEEVRVTWVLTRARQPGLSLDRIAALLLGAALVTLGWWLGTRSANSPPTPASLGTLLQIPTAQPCLEKAPAPLPRYVDVHTDGLGRLTGFSFGGPAGVTLEACMKEALVNLDFPPTHDGLPAFHRYYLSEDPP
jgi:hypothetical protein